MKCFKKHLSLVLFSFVIMIIGLGLFSVWNNDTKVDTFSKYSELILAMAAATVVLGMFKNTQDERESTRFNERIKYLSKAYELIALGVDRNPDNLEYNEYVGHIEKAVAMIQLYDDPENVKIICKKIEEFRKTTGRSEIDFNDEITSLRDRLRKDLGLAHICEKVSNLRYQRAPFNSI